MKSWQHKLFGVAAVFAVLTSAGCASVPKEVVELSYRMGQDLDSVHSSYLALIHSHFDSLRQTTIDFVDNEWTPVFIEQAVTRGRLVAMAKGEVVRSGRQFVAPTAGREQMQLLESVGAWAVAATARIQSKKTELLDPINKAETSLTSDVNNAFDQLGRGNATITAHLNSLRKVQEVQDQALESLNLKNLRDTVNNRLVQASDLAADGIEKVRRADNVVKQFDTFVNELH